MVTLELISCVLVCAPIIGIVNIANNVAEQEKAEKEAKDFIELVRFIAKEEA